jgi:outer membrane receptor for ferrienterochelin and colicin
MYLEFASTVSAEPHTPWIGTLDIGFTYAITEDVQLDGGVNLGLTRAADDVNPFVGLSWRF